jgi:hypothetical protein
MYDRICVAAGAGRKGADGHSMRLSAFAGSRPLAAGGDELLGIELLEEHARRLAALLSLGHRRGGGRAHLKRLNEHMRVLREVYVALAEDVRRGEPATPAAEWLLDNVHIVSATARDIRHDLPTSFFRRLPTIAADEFAGLPRIFALALELIRCSAGRLDAQRLHRFITAFQSVTPLTIGELWAWPSMLKLALLENLRRLTDEMLAARDQRRAADECVSRTAAPAGSTPTGSRARSRTRRRCSAGRPTSTRPSSRACSSARASTARPRRRSATSSTPSWPSGARRSRTRSSPKGGTRRPNRRPWRT